MFINNSLDLLTFFIELQHCPSVVLYLVYNAKHTYNTKIYKTKLRFRKFAFGRCEKIFNFIQSCTVNKPWVFLIICLSVRISSKTVVYQVDQLEYFISSVLQQSQTVEIPQRMSKRGLSTERQKEPCGIISIHFSFWSVTFLKYILY